LVLLCVFFHEVKQCTVPKCRPVPPYRCNFSDPWEPRNPASTHRMRRYFYIPELKMGKLKPY
jgi:hypothetical protein